jgi:hypothetical protein
MNVLSTAEEQFFQDFEQLNPSEQRELMDDYMAFIEASGSSSQGGGEAYCLALIELAEEESAYLRAVAEYTEGYNRVDVGTADGCGGCNGGASGFPGVTHHSYCEGCGSRCLTRYAAHLVDDEGLRNGTPGRFHISICARCVEHHSPAAVLTR